MHQLPHRYTIDGHAPQVRLHPDLTLAHTGNLRLPHATDQFDLILQILGQMPESLEIVHTGERKTQDRNVGTDVDRLHEGFIDISRQIGTRHVDLVLGLLERAVDILSRQELDGDERDTVR